MVEITGAGLVAGELGAGEFSGPAGLVVGTGGDKLEPGPTGVDSGAG